MMFIKVAGDYLYTAGRWDTMLPYNWETIANADWEIWKTNFGYSNVLIEGFSVNHTIEAPSTANFRVLDTMATWTWYKGDQVTIWDETEALIFKGYIDQVTEELFIKGMKIHDVQCIDYHYITDKRLVGRAWVSKRPDEVVQDLLDDYLVDEGITLGQIDTSDVTIDNVLFDYITISSALDRMCEYAGYTWYISVDKELFFTERSDFTAPWNLWENDGVVENVVHGSFKLTRCAPEYRNRQIIKAGKDTTSTQTETFVGDGSQRTFVVAYPVAETPTITVDSVSKTVGIRGIDTDKDWYWSKNTSEINQELADTPVADGDAVVIAYKGMYSIVSITQDSTAIADVKAREDGTGIVESLEDRPELTSTTEAKFRGNTLLEQYAQSCTKIEYDAPITEVVFPGVMQDITIPTLALSGNVLITSNEITYQGQQKFQHITGSIGPTNDHWTKLFVKLTQFARSKLSDQTSAESAVITVTESPFHKDWSSSEYPNPWKEFLITGAYTPATAGVFGFQWASDAFKYLVLYYDVGGTDTEFYRVPITSRTTSTEGGSSLETVVALVPSSGGNDQVISAVGLWGGNWCTSTAGTGCCLHKADYDHEKNINEIIQLTFEEHHWV